MDDLNQIIHRNLSHIQSRIAAACQRARRAPETVRLIAVTKYAQLEWVQALVELGCHDLGESRTPQLEERAALLSPEIRWHFIGPLQRNKVRRTIQHSSLIHSVDSLKLLNTIDRIAGEAELQPEVLIEVNLSGEASKKGFTREALCAEWEAICSVSEVKVTGLMTMAPHVQDPELARPVFRELRELRDELQKRSPDRFSLQELSMGMSGDFEVGIEEGATLVRVGSALYAGLESSQES